LHGVAAYCGSLCSGILQRKRRNMLRDTATQRIRCERNFLSSDTVLSHRSAVITMATAFVFAETERNKLKTSLRTF